MERILVTGATGFIGCALCKALVDAGHQVRASYIESLVPDQFNGNVEWVRTEPLGPATDWSAALSDITRVVHLAGLAHGAAESASEDELMRVNALGTKRLAEAAAVTRVVKRLVLMSSVAAVVATDAGIVEEGMPPGPASPYGRSKCAAENAVRTTLGASGCEYVILRPTLVYGAGNPGNMQRLQRLVGTGLPLPFARIKNRRSFCYLGNVVSALCTAVVHPGAANQDFTVCDNETVSTPELIRTIAESTGKRARLLPVPARLLSAIAVAGDSFEAILHTKLPFDSDAWVRLSGSLVGSNAKLSAKCDWTPPYSLQEGLRETLGSHP